MKRSWGSFSILSPQYKGIYLSGKQLEIPIQLNLVWNQTPVCHILCSCYLASIFGQWWQAYISNITQQESFLTSAVLLHKKYHSCLCFVILCMLTIVILSPYIEEVHHLMVCFSESCDESDLTINLRKTFLIYQPTPGGKGYILPSIYIKCKMLEVLNTFVYLVIILSRFNTPDIHVS